MILQRASPVFPYLILVLIFRHLRSITLVGEKERKMLKDIVKNSNIPVKNRLMSPGIDYFLIHWIFADGNECHFVS